MAKGYNYEMKPGESLESYYRRLAKVADQRLVRLERLSLQPGYGNADQWAYKRARSDIETWSGEGAKRFNTKPPKDARSLKAKINDIRAFLGSESSTKSGITSVYQSRVNTINKRYGTNYQIDDMQQIFSSSLWKKLDAKNYSSDQILTAIGYIKDNATDDDAFEALKAQARKRKELPEFTGDPFIDQAIKEMLRSTKSVNEMYNYFKSI